jgi:hypothetical protein
LREIARVIFGGTTWRASNGSSSDSWRRKPLRFDRLPDARAQDPQVLRRLCGTDTMGPIELVVALTGVRALTVTAPGASPFELQAGSGLRFEVKGQPGITVEFELDESGAVARLVAQPLGVFRPKNLTGLRRTRPGPQRQRHSAQEPLIWDPTVSRISAVWSHSQAEHPVSGGREAP